MRLTLLIILSLFLVECRFGRPSIAVVQFDRDTINFGAINKGESIVVNFAFRNIGEGPLKIINVEPSCNCSNVSYPKQAFEKDSSGQISVTYSNSKDGFDTAITKLLVVETNCNPMLHTLTLKGMIRFPAMTYSPISLTK